MENNKQTPEARRERMRQNEWKRNPTGNLNDSHNRGSSGSLVDLVGSLGWKGTGIFILVIIISYFIYALFFR